MEENIYFDYVSKDGKTIKAEVLTIFMIDGSSKKYALCSIPNNEGDYDITAFIVNESNPEEISFDDILDQDELSNVEKAANEIMRR